MKDILECTDTELIMELPINKAVQVDLTLQDEKQIPYGVVGNECIIESSQSYQRLCEFIGTIQSKNVVYGNCPTCKAPTYYTVTNVYCIPSSIDYKCILRYHDVQSDFEDLPDATELFISQVNNLVDTFKFFDKRFQCPNCKKIYQVSFALEKNFSFSNNNIGQIYLIKIGQYPSLQEFAVVDFKAFNKSLDKYKIKDDYRNAIRNHINGDNIAAYVYLRRIIEKIIFNTYENHQQDINVTSDDFNKAHIEDKIKYLKQYLPTFLSENKAIYSVISAGIHSLSEEKCQEYYDTLKDSIDIMLHQEEAKRKEKAMIERTTKELQNVIQDARGNSNSLN